MIMWQSAGYRGWALMLGGDTPAAEQQFKVADVIYGVIVAGSGHLTSLWGVWWGEFLARTGRPGSARTLTERNRDHSVYNRFSGDVARIDRLLGRLDLAMGDTTSAGPRLTAAAATFRDGDYLVELAATLSILAECACADGDLDGADRFVEEALHIAAPRGLRLTQAAALIVRARAYADCAASGSRNHLWRGRDAAEAAYRIATRHRLAWHELDSLDAHARLDQVEGVDHTWSRQATALRARLTPAGLDPDPMASVERLVAEEIARQQGEAAE
jgi:hypothetical protein